MTGPLTLDALKKLVEELANRQLDEYTATLCVFPVSRGKDVNDALWGTVSFTRMEVALLDSPLLQRLRYIRQRGAAHWVYPGAVHTRFEHLLGAMAMVRSMAAAFNQAVKASLNRSESSPISESTVQVLRLAMILREAAQMAFSQASEGALSDLPAFATLPKAFSEALRVETDSASEDVSLPQIVGYFLARSDAMRKLLGLLLDREGSSLEKVKEQTADHVEDVVRRISLAIIGRRIDDTLPLVHELVFGPFDAESIDALMRDARFAGLPTLMDEQRLLQKLDVKRMPLEEMPDAILTAISEGNAKADTWLFGVKASAAAVLDELQLARMLVTSKIYQHPKVLAVEQMLRSAIGSLVEAADATAVLCLLFSSSDDAVLGMHADGLALALGIKADEGAKMQRVAAAAELLAALRDRRLWVRAFQFPEWSSALDMGRNTSQELELMRSELRHIEKGPVLMGRVRDEAHRILDLLQAGKWGRLSLDSLVSARSLECTSSDTEVGRAYIIRPSQKSYQFSELLSIRGSWLDHYNAGQPRDHVFSPPDIADAVYVAFERVARIDYGVWLPESSIEASKRDSEQIDTLKRKLWAKGYWNQTPYDIRPVPACLKRAGISKQLAPFYDLRTKYLAPAGGGNPHSSRTVVLTTQEWLQQFDDDSHVVCAMRLLASVKMLDRDDLFQALKTFLEAHPEFKGAWVAPFGDAKDSGSVQSYFAGDARAGGLISELGSLEQYVVRGAKRPIIFVDDFSGSGNQACDILAAMLDRDNLRRKLGEHREKLPQDQAAAMLSVPVAFLFVAGWEAGLKAIRDICHQLKLNAKVFALLTDDDLHFADKVLKKDHSITQEAAAKFLARCEEIGKQLVESEPRDEPLAAEKVESRKLGYGNRGMLLVTPFNTPTQALTALWMEGEVDGQPWKPLFPRRKKK
jgi:deoxynucleoside triphosphate triphosphohydrolase SAMHD1